MRSRAKCRSKKIGLFDIATKNFSDYTNYEMLFTGCENTSVVTIMRNTLKRKSLIHFTNTRKLLEITPLQQDLSCFESFDKYIKNVRTHVTHWNISGDNSNLLKQCVLFIEETDHPWFDVTLRLHRRYLGSYWMFFLYVPSQIAPIVRLKYSGEMINIQEIPSHLIPRSWNKDSTIHILKFILFHQQSVPRHFERVLLSSANTVLLRYGIEDFSNHVRVHMYRQNKSFDFIDSNGKFLFSLWKRNALIRHMKQLISKRSKYFSKIKEDSVVLNRFASSDNCLVFDYPFGVQPLWTHCSNEQCLRILYCSLLNYQTLRVKNSKIICQ
jgi:hypothetical protein